MDRPTAIWLAIMCFALTGSLALYSCVPYIEEDLLSGTQAALGDSLAPRGWAEVEVDGQTVILKGNPPDDATWQAAVRVLESVRGVIGVENQTVVSIGRNHSSQLDTGLMDLQATDGASEATVAGAEPASGGNDT